MGRTHAGALAPDTTVGRRRARPHAMPWRGPETQAGARGGRGLCGGTGRGRVAEPARAARLEPARCAAGRSVTHAEGAPPRGPGADVPRRPSSPTSHGDEHPLRPLAPLLRPGEGSSSEAGSVLTGDEEEEFGRRESDPGPCSGLESSRSSIRTASLPKRIRDGQPVERLDVEDSTGSAHQAEGDARRGRRHQETQEDDAQADGERAHRRRGP